MMKVPFMYKYQPKCLDDCKMDENMRVLNKTLLSIDSLNILLVGNSGSGKTTLINVLIREYYESKIKMNNHGIGNSSISSSSISSSSGSSISDTSTSTSKNLLYNDNILYINSLKEQGITYYRNEMKTFCQTTSTIPGKKKIIVLDDIDCINDQSQQVFRNFIDKYSHNVHFLASCSNTQNVVDTIQSRMTILKVKPLSRDNLKQILHKICDCEKINITKSAEEIILSISNNSVRILINYLEKCKLLDVEITDDLVDSICTNISFKNLKEYTEICKYKKNRVDATQMIYNLYDKGYSVMDILDNYFLYVKTCDIVSEDEKYKIIRLLCKYITVFHNIHEDEIELALFTNNLIRLFV